MGLWRWLFGSPLMPDIVARTIAPTRQNHTVSAWIFEGPGHFRTQIHGESFYVREITASLAGKKPWEEHCTFTAVLMPERNNIHDKNAVGIYRVDGGQVGHLTRAAARTWREPLDAMKETFGTYVACNAEVGCGGPGLVMGVWLDIELRDVRKELEARRDAARHPKAE